MQSLANFHCKTSTNAKSLLDSRRALTRALQKPAFQTTLYQPTWNSDGLNLKILLRQIILSLFGLRLLSPFLEEAVGHSWRRTVAWGTSSLQEHTGFHCKFPCPSNLVSKFSNASSIDHDRGVTNLSVWDGKLEKTEHRPDLSTFKSLGKKKIPLSALSHVGPKRT